LMAKPMRLSDPSPAYCMLGPARTRMTKSAVS
jgi:hypothetical protein